MKIKVDVIHVPIYTIVDENGFGKEVSNIHPQQIKWFNNCVKEFWKAQNWIQQVRNETSNSA